jgi:hypothetical protein
MGTGSVFFLVFSALRVPKVAQKTPKGAQRQPRRAQGERGGSQKPQKECQRPPKKTPKCDKNGKREKNKNLPFQEITKTLKKRKFLN